MNKPLPSHLEEYVVDARESENIELKRHVDLDSSAQKEEFAKDVCSIANSGDFVGYILIGVNDRKHREKGDANVPGIVIINKESYEQKIISVVSNYCQNPPRVQVDYYQYNEVTIVVISIYAKARPHFLKGSATVILRRGSQKSDASVDEILMMAQETMKINTLIDVYDNFLYMIENFTENNIARNSLLPFLSQKLEIIKHYNDSRYYYLLAKAYKMMGLFSNSIDNIESALEIRNDPSYRKIQAEIYLDYGRDVYNQAIQNSESIAITDYALAITCAEKSRECIGIARSIGGNIAEAKKIFREADKLVADARIGMQNLQSQQGDA